MLCLQLMDFQQVPLETFSVILKIVSTEIIWRNVFSFIREEKFNFFCLIVMVESADIIWVSTFMTLEQKFWDGNDIIWAGFVWEIFACWSSSFYFCPPIAFG